MNIQSNFNEVILGKNACYELINQNPGLIKVVHLLKKDDELIKQLEVLQIPFLIHEHDHYFTKFNNHVNHQGYVIELKPTNSFLNIISWDQLAKKTGDLQKLSIILVLDEITDMQNFGAILRTAYACDVDAVIFKKDHQAQINDYIVKTSMGFIHKIPLLPVVNLVNAIKKLQNELHYWVYASALGVGCACYDQVDYAKHSVLIVGNEHKGISRLVKENADQLIQIPMFNQVDSLNVSVSTGVLLFHIRSQLTNNDREQDTTKF